MKVAVIAAHPDDETLGCGGAILRHIARGDALDWIVVSEPTTPQWGPEMITRKGAEVERVAAAYAVSGLRRLAFASTQLEHADESDLIEQLRGLTADAELVYVVSGVDAHSDHRVVFEATNAALKPFRRGGRPSRLLAYETISSTDAAPGIPGRGFNPNVFVDVSSFIDEKLRILDMYETEIQSGSMPRTPDAVRALARVRGATIGVPYAEAFMLVREVITGD